MKTKTSGVILLGLVGVAVAAWFYTRNENPTVNQPQATQTVERPVIEKREPTASPKPNETAKEAAPEIPSPSLRNTAEVMRDLVKAGEDCNLKACRAAYDELKTRADLPAKTVAAEFDAQAAKERSNRQQLFVLGFLGLLLDVRDYSSLFTYLRAVWAKEGLSEVRAKVWERNELMPVDKPAEAALTDEKDVMHADVVAFVMRERFMDKSSDRLTALIKEMLGRYDEFKFVDRKAMREIPDAWISRVLTRTVGEVRIEGKDAPIVAPYKEMCKTIAAGAQFSPRLRAQARLYFLPPTKDFIDLLVAVGASASQNETAKLLAAFIDAQKAETITWSLLWDALIEKYGASKTIEVLLFALPWSRKLRNFGDAQQYATAIVNDFMAGNDNPDHALIINSALCTIVSEGGLSWNNGKDPQDASQPRGLFVGMGVNVAELVRRFRKIQVHIERKYTESQYIAFIGQLMLNTFEGDTPLPEALTTAKELAEQVSSWADVWTHMAVSKLIGPRRADIPQYASDVKAFIQYLLEREVPNPAAHDARSSKQFAVQVLCSLAACLKLALYPRLSEKAITSMKRMEAVASEFVKGGSEKYFREALKPAITELRAEGYLSE